MKLNKPLTNAKYAEFAVYCNKKGLIIADRGDFIEAVEPPPTPRKEELQARRVVYLATLEKLDYIGVKIATGRATVEEYAEEIEQMKIAAAAINEIDDELARLEAGTN